MMTATLSHPTADATCPAPPPPPPPTPPKFDARMERAIKVACQGPPFPEEVFAALRNLLPPVATPVTP